ncbi:MAG TPA: hypothetical protein VIT64_16115 [Ilumatobacteraceae bacterium]
MELSSYLRSRWGILLIAIPAITGAIAFATTKPAEQFEAVGIVSVTPPDAIESSQFSTGPFVADFRSMLTSTAVEEAVEEALVAVGAEPPGPASASAGLNGGALVQVGITASTPEAAELAIRTAVTESLSALNRQNVERAEIVASARAAEAAAAQSALTDFATENQVQDVEGEYARRSGDLLETRNAVAANPGNTALVALLEEKKVELDRYGALLLEWQLLEDSLRTSVSARDSATAALSLARARSDSVGERSLVESVTVTQAGQVTGRALAGVIGAAAAFAVVAAAIAVARRPKRQAALAPEPPVERASAQRAPARGEPARTTAPPRRQKRPVDTGTSDVDAPFSVVANGDRSLDRERESASRRSPTPAASNGTRRTTNGAPATADKNETRRGASRPGRPR